MHGLAALRDMARNMGGDHDDPVPDAVPPAPPASGPRPEAPQVPAAAPPQGEAAPADPASEAAPQPAPRPRMALREGHKMTFGEQARAVFGVTWRQARRNLREMRNKPGGLIRGLFTARGPSVDEQIEYKKEQRYLPAGYDEDSIPALAGDLYHELVGIPGVAAGQAWIGLVSRPLRAGIAFFLVYVPVALLLIIFGVLVFGPGMVAAGLGMLAGLAVAVIVALIGLEARSSARRRAKQPPPDEDDGDDDGDWDEEDPEPGAGYEPPSQTRG